MPKKIAWLASVTLILLAACGGAAGGGPATAIEDYFKALVGKNAAQAIALSCAAWEANAQTDADTFAVYPATMDSVSCKAESQTGDTAVVTCTGKIVLDYNGEKQDLNLADRTYAAALEGGQWRMCGYK